MPRPFQIHTPAQLAALSSPVRQEILDAVAALGPATVPAIASLLGRPADALYYHTRTLERLGLLIAKGPAKERATENGAARRGRRPETLYDVPARPLRIRYRPADPQNRAGVQRAVGAVLRLASRDFAVGLRSPHAVTDGPYRNVWGGRVKGWATPAQLRELNRALDRISRILSQPRTAPSAAPRRDPGVQLCSIAFVLAPVTPRSRRRAAPQAKAATKPRTSHTKEPRP